MTSNKNGTVVYICETASSPLGFGVARPNEIASRLVCLGYRVFIIAANRSNSFPVPYKSGVTRAKGVVYIRVDGYENIKNPIIRALSMMRFAMSVGVLLLTHNAFKSKSDVTLITSSTGNLDCFPAALVTLINRKCRWIQEVRDVWPEAPKNLSDSKLMAPFLLLTEVGGKLGYKYSDAMLSPLLNATRLWDGIKRKKEPRFLHIPNCISSDYLTSNLLIEDGYPKLSQEIELARSSGKLVVLYSGSVNRANGLERFCEIAKHFDSGKALFIVVGSGPLESKVQSYSNVISCLKLFPAVEKSYVKSLLDSADVLFLGLQWIDVYKYGLAPIKASEYVNSGKCILNWGVVPDAFKAIPDRVFEVEGESVQSAVDALKKVHQKMQELKKKPDFHECHGVGYDDYVESLGILIKKIKVGSNDKIEDNNELSANGGNLR